MAASPGVKTTEFQVTAVVQIVMVAVLVAKRFGYEIQVSEAEVVAIMGGVAAAYGVCRSIVKAFASHSEAKVEIAMMSSSQSPGSNPDAAISNDPQQPVIGAPRVPTDRLGHPLPPNQGG